MFGAVSRATACSATALNHVRRARPLGAGRKPSRPRQPVAYCSQQQRGSAARHLSTPVRDPLPSIVLTTREKSVAWPRPPPRCSSPSRSSSVPRYEPGPDHRAAVRALTNAKRRHVTSGRVQISAAPVVGCYGACSYDNRAHRPRRGRDRICRRGCSGTSYWNRQLTLPSETTPSTLLGPLTPCSVATSLPSLSGMARCNASGRSGMT